MLEITFKKTFLSIKTLGISKLYFVNLNDKIEHIIKLTNPEDRTTPTAP